MVVAVEVSSLIWVERVFEAMSHLVENVRHSVSQSGQELTVLLLLLFFSRIYSLAVVYLKKLWLWNWISFHSP